MKKIIVKSFDEADKILTGPDMVKVDSNTYLCRSGPDVIYLTYHDSEIITYFKDGTVKISDGGYQSNSTKAKINAYMPFSVSQLKNKWYVHTQMGVFGFKSGMLFHSDGHSTEGTLHLVSPPPSSMTDEERWMPEPDYHRDAVRNED